MNSYYKTVEGTGAALNVELGMVPDFVKITNIETDKMDMVEILTDTDGAITSAILTTASTGVRTSDVANYSLYVGSTSAAKGITLGASAGVNVSSDTLWIEYGTYPNV